VNKEHHVGDKGMNYLATQFSFTKIFRQLLGRLGLSEFGRSSHQKMLLLNYLLLKIWFRFDINGLNFARKTHFTRIFRSVTNLSSDVQMNLTLNRKHLLNRDHFV